MKTVFVDTYYWVNGLSPKGKRRQEAAVAEAALGSAHFITTEAVLIEILNFFSGYQPIVKQRVVKAIRDILDDLETEVVFHSHDQFQNGLKLYESRLDKGYSLTDCISMNVMRELGISEVLTNDHHFAQEGFVVLI
ncbi:MAG: PIN domain-containing protein [Acidobacteriota bacterium]|nr:PIN domain-containing protein [Acidobacteriota bacterium]